MISRYEAQNLGSKEGGSITVMIKELVGGRFKTSKNQGKEIDDGVIIAEVKRRQSEFMEL